MFSITIIRYQTIAETDQYKSEESRVRLARRVGWYKSIKVEQGSQSFDINLNQTKPHALGCHGCAIKSLPYKNVVLDIKYNLIYFQIPLLQMDQYITCQQSMQSESKSSLQENQAQCQVYLKELNKMFDLFQQKHEAIELFCRKSVAQVKDICDTLAQSLTIFHLQLTSKQKAASLLNTFLKFQMHSFEFVVKQYHSIFFNFSIEPKVKGMFTRSLFSLITKYSDELEGLFQSSTESLIQVVETLSIIPSATVSSYTAPPISISRIPEPFTFSLEWPTDMHDIYATLILLGEVFIDNDAHPNPKYKGELAVLFRRVNKLLLNQEGLFNHVNLVDQLLDFWVNLAGQSWNDEPEESTRRRSATEEEQQAKQRRMAAIMEIKTWPEFYDQLELILNFLTPTHHFPEIGLTVHNYLAVTQNWEQHSIFSTKAKAAQLISTVMMLLQATDYLGGKSSQELSQSARRMQWSIYTTLKQLIEAPSTNLKNLEIASTILDLFATLISTHPQSFSDHQIVDFLANATIPILDFYLAQIKELFKENVEECLNELEDCCQDHSRGTILGKLAKMIEAICDQNESALAFLISYIRYSLEERQNAAFEPWQVPESVLELKATSCQAALLLLGIISYKTEALMACKDALSKLFVRPFIAVLTDFQRALFYNCMGYIMVDIFAEDNAGVHSILMSTLDPMSYQVRFFAVNLVSQTEVKYFSRQFIAEFLSHFMDLGDIQDKWIVLTHLVSERLHDFDETYLIGMIARGKEVVLSQSEAILSLMQQGKEHTTVEISNLLYFCMHIAENYDYCLKHPSIQEALWQVVLTLPVVSQLFLDDILVKTATQLLCPVSRLPQHFPEVLTAVTQSFSCSEFEGIHFYTFLQTAILAGRCDQKETIDKIYLCLSEVFSYVLYFPENRAFEMILNMSNAIVSLQSLLLAHPTIIDNVQVEELEKLCLETLQRKNLPELREYPPVEGKTVALLLMVQKMKGEKLILETVLTKANQHCFMGEDALLLLYLLREYLGSIRSQSRYQIFTVVIYCLRTEYYKKALKDRQDYVKLNSIYNYVERPVKLQYKLQKQAKSLLHHFETTFHEEYKASLAKLRQADIDSLNSLLQDNTPPPRKILRVMGPSRGPRAQTDQPQLLPIIRGAEPWMQEESGQLRKRMKEKEVSKYEMMLLKREKKGS